MRPSPRRPPSGPACSLRLACAAAIASAALEGCGARSSLGFDDRGAGATAGGSDGGAAGAATSSSATGPACTSDAECDDGVACTVDVCGDIGCEHVADHAACDDGVLCTLDTCNDTLGCSNALSPVVCDDGIACTNDTCDVATDTCLNEPCDSRCDDAFFCNGVERCDAARGCTSGPPACDLGLGCDVSSCAEAGDICSHTLPPGCVPPDVHLLVTDSSGNLYDVAPYETPSSTLIAPTLGFTHLDIAVLNGRWFAIDASLVELTPGTNQILNDLGPLDANSLAGGPDGMLYAANTWVIRIDPDSGAQQYLGELPPGHSSSGDIAFLGDRMFISTDSGCGGGLVEFAVATATGAVLGGDGLGCVYGLAGVGDQLFLVNCDGRLGSFDPDAGEARIFSITPVLAYGADLLP